MIHCFKNGEEVPLEIGTAKKEVKASTSEKKPKTENKKVKKMATAKKAKPAKKAKSKTAKVTKDRPAVKGSNKTLTIKAMLAEIKKGSKIFRKEDSAPLPEGYLAKMKDATREMEVTVVAAE
jgi:hypothetical protein